MIKTNSIMVAIAIFLTSGCNANPKMHDICAQTRTSNAGVVSKEWLPSISDQKNLSIMLPKDRNIRCFQKLGEDKVLVFNFSDWNYVTFFSIVDGKYEIIKEEVIVLGGR